MNIGDTGHPFAVWSFGMKIQVEKVFICSSADPSAAIFCGVGSPPVSRISSWHAELSWDCGEFLCWLSATVTSVGSRKYGSICLAVDGSFQQGLHPFADGSSAWQSCNSHFWTLQRIDTWQARDTAPGKAHTTGKLARRYVVKIKRKETYLYETNGRWFVEMKA